MRFHILILVFFSFSAISCQQPSSTENDKSEIEPVSTVPTINNSAPNSDTIPYPIVERFEDIAHIFEYQNDTTYVINFWATWCSPCVKELPYFEQLAKDKADQPVQFIMVSLDFKKQVRTKLLQFVKNRPLTLPVIALTDTKTNEWIDKVDPNWSGAIPITIIYKGDQRQFIEGEFDDYESLVRMVDEVTNS